MRRAWIDEWLVVVVWGLGGSFVVFLDGLISDPSLSRASSSSSSLRRARVCAHSILTKMAGSSRATSSTCGRCTSTTRPPRGPTR